MSLYIEFWLLLIYLYSLLIDVYSKTVKYKKGYKMFYKKKNNLKINFVNRRFHEYISWFSKWMEIIKFFDIKNICSIL